MVRVKSEAYTKASVKAPRKQTALKSDSTPKNGKSSKYSGGNTYCPRSTPNWQKPITSFFSKNGSQGESAEENVPKEDFAATKSASSPEPVPCCSKDSVGPVENVEESEHVSAVPCCSKDSVGPVENVEESEHVSGEESMPDSCPKENSNEEQSCILSGSSEADNNSPET